MKLTVNKIQDDNDFASYLSIVKLFDVINPFSRFLKSIINEGDGNELGYFTLKDDEGDIKILMPFILRKIPYTVNNTTYYDVISPYGYSGPLFNKDMSRGYLITFWEQVDSWYKKNNVVSEFIRFSLNNNFQFYSGVLIPTLSNVRGVILDEETQWNNLKQKVRTNCRKAIANNLKIEIAYKNVQNADVERFYNIYISTMKRVNANTDYFYSLEYFKNIARLSKDKIAFVFIYKDDIAISTELILIAGDTLYSYLGGTLMDYFKLRPNDFLKVEVMKWARKNNFKYYNLGGGREDFDNLYRYKKSFFPNDDDVIFYTGRTIVNKTIYHELEKITNTIPENNADKNKISFFPSYRKAVLPANKKTA